MKIDERLIGVGHTLLVIAIMSGDHNQSLGKALEIVEVAAKSKHMY